MTRLRDVSDPMNAARPMTELRRLAADCGLDPGRAVEHGLVALAPAETRDLVGKRLASIGFVYHALDGTPVGVGRVRLIEAPEDCPKYLQPAGSVPRLYLPQGHGVNWEMVAEKGVPVLVITEGEKKAHAGCAAGVPTVGIGGVWMGARKKAGGGKLLLPELRVLCAHTPLIATAYDSDKASNEHVLKAEIEIHALLRGFGKEARTIDIPPGVDGSKQGLDDHLRAAGGRVAAKRRMKELLDESRVVADINDEWVTERNGEWCYVENVGEQTGGPYVLIDGTARMGVVEFEQVYSADRATYDVLGKLTKKREGWIWRHHPKCRRVLREVFHTTPDPVPEGCLNRYAAPSKPNGKTESIGPALDFFHHIGTADERSWYLSAIAHTVQTGLRTEWGIFCWSAIQGAGKTFFGKLLGACFSPYFIHLTSADIKRENFGKKWFENMRFMLIDEGDDSDASGRSFANMLKHMGSGGTLVVEEKRLPARRIDNRTFLYLASNHLATRHIPLEDRRVMVLHPTERVPKDVAAAADAWLHVRPGDRTSVYRPEAMWALWSYFMRFHVRPDFDPVYAPMTEAKRDAIEHGFSDLELPVVQLMNEGTFFEHAMPEVVTTKMLASTALGARLGMASDSERLREAIRFGRQLQARGAVSRTLKLEGKVEKLWAVRNIEAWRRRDNAWWRKEAGSGWVGGEEVGGRIPPP